MIHATASKLHWNYFLALEKDLEVVSRYVEFGSQNFDTYSIEFAHLLFAAVSEVHVIAKLLCKRLAPAQSIAAIPLAQNKLGRSAKPAFPDEAQRGLNDLGADIDLRSIVDSWQDTFATLKA